jgi:hypothetical protein
MSNAHNYPLLGQAFLTSVPLSANASLSGTDSGKAFVNTPATAAITITLPKAVPGRRFIFVETSAHNMVIQPQAVDTIRGSGLGAATTLAALGTNLLLTCVVNGFWELF